MMMETAEIVLYAMWRQAEDEGRHLTVDTHAVGAAMSDIDLFERHVHLNKTDNGRTLRIQFG
jgi:hypothetical protein